MSQIGRPTLHTPEVEEKILESLMEGESLRRICLREDMPHRSTVIRWMGEDESFATKCARAREMQADLMDDLVLETAENCTPETAFADRVKIAAYQWRAAKLQPKKYGDSTKIEHTGADGGPLAITITETIVDPRADDSA